MGKEDEGFFRLKKKVTFDEILKGEVTELPESDLCFQNENIIAQFEYVTAEDEKKIIIKPGVYELSETPSGVEAKKIELRTYDLLEEVDNTSTIINEAKVFFSKLDIYEKLKRPKKRGVLLYSSPGMGKTSAISKFCRDFIVEDPGTVVINWPTAEIEAKRVSKFLSVYTEYDPTCTRLILIIEDIGGEEYENAGRPNQVDSGMLNLLDGVNVTFRLPTFIVATTNHPENLLGALADRPGRFDLMLELEPPTLKEKIKLLEFIAKRACTEEEKKSLDSQGAKKFSIAHLEEVVIRSLLHNKSIPIVVEELIDHAEKFKKGFSKKSDMGIGF